MYVKAAPKDTLSNLHKDIQEGSFESTLKVALEVALKELNCWYIQLSAKVHKIIHLMVDLMLHYKEDFRCTLKFTLKSHQRCTKR